MYVGDSCIHPLDITKYMILNKKLLTMMFICYQQTFTSDAVVSGPEYSYPWRQGTFSSYAMPDLLVEMMTSH